MLDENEEFIDGVDDGNNSYGLGLGLMLFEFVEEVGFVLDFGCCIGVCGVCE